MRPNELKDEIKSRNENQIRRALYVEAKPGVGKTEIAGQAAAEAKVGFMSIHAPLLQPEDYGLPVPSKDRDTVNFVVAHDKFPLVGSKCPDTGIFLIDELPQADTAAQKILANLIQEREIHGKKLKAGWTIVATGNRAKDRSGANRILGHLGNRVTRVGLEVKLDDWTQWALANAVKTEVVAFIRFRPDFLDCYDPNLEVNATPRSWVQGVSDNLGITAPQSELEVFSGDVGEGPASEFLAFLKVFRNLPSPDAILLDPKKIPVPTDLATLYALCGALAHKATRNNLANALTYVRRIPKQEFSALFMKDCISRNKELAETKSYIDWASKEGADLLT
jgi:hypothetical protein